MEKYHDGIPVNGKDKWTTLKNVTPLSTAVDTAEALEEKNKTSEPIRNHLRLMATPGSRPVNHHSYLQVVH